MSTRFSASLSSLRLPSGEVRHESRAKTLLYSGWQCSFRISILEITGHKRLRRDTGLESQLPGGCAIWRVLQVRILAICVHMPVMLTLPQVTAFRQ